MKASAATLVLILASLVPAHATKINTQAFSYFTDAGGNVGFVFVSRKIDPVTKVITTTLSYSFCVQTTAASCQEGNGVIPNSAFAGTLNAYPWRTDTVKVVADTTIPGFVNQLCNAPYIEGCQQGLSPATGGPIILTYVTTPGSEEDFTFYDWHLLNYKLVLNSKDKTSQGPASVQGTVLGTNVNNKGAGWGVEVVSGLGSPGSQAKQAQSHLTLEKSLAPATLHRLQRLMGTKAAE